MSFSDFQPDQTLVTEEEKSVVDQPIAQNMATGSFDMESAIKEGYSPSEIAQFLSNQVGFDYQQASNEGYSDDEIISYVSKQSEAIPDVRALSKPAAAVEGTARGLLVGAPATYGGIKGAVYGGLLGLRTPYPLLTAPLGAILGGVAGLVGGSSVGGFAEDLLMPEDAVGPEARPFLEGGKTFGSALPSVVVPYRLPVDINLGSRMYSASLARMTDPSVKRTIVNSMGKTLSFLEKGLSKGSQAAKATPVVFGTAETIAAGGAGIAGGLSEAVDPGDTVTRILAETAGGFFAPKKVLINFAPAIKTSLSNAVQPLSRAGRQDMAAQKLRSVFEEKGEDVDAVIKALREDSDFLKLAKELGVESGEMRPAIMFDSPALREIENRVAAGFPGMSAELRQQTKDNMDVVNSIIDVLRNQGDPGSLAVAAQMRQKYFEELLTANLNVANTTALRAADRIPVSQKSAQEAGKAVETVARSSLEDARRLERQLYARVDRTVPIDIAEDSSILSDFRQLETEHPDIVPKEIRDRVGKLFPQVDSVNEARDAYLLNVQKLGDSLATAKTKTTEALGRLSSEDRFLIGQRLGKNTYQFTDDFLENVDDYSVGRLLEFRDEISKSSSNRPLSYKDANGVLKSQVLSKEAKKEMLKYVNSLVDASSFQTGLNTLKAQGVPQVPAAAMEEGTSATLGQLMDFRTTMRSLGAQASARKDFQTANFFGRMNGAALKDLKSVVDRQAGKEGGEKVLPLFEAYQYSQALNNVFTRAFAGDVLAKDADSSLRILPETLAAKLFSDGNDAVALRTQQLIEAAEFMSSKAAQEVGGKVPDSLASNLGTMNAAAEDMLRYAARKVVNSDTGLIKPEALSDFIRDNQVVLEMFPSLLEDLSNAQRAQKLLDAAIDENSVAKKSIDNQSAFARFLDSPDNPATTLQAMLGSPGSRKADSVVEFKKLIRFAKEDSNPEVLDGLLDTVLERAWNYGGGGTGSENLNIGKFKAYLYEPLGKGQLSIIQIMREQGVIPEDTVGKLRVALTQSDLANQSLKDATGKSKGPLVDAPARVIDSLAALLGTRVGTAISERIPGRKQGIIEAAVFANLGREWLTKIPNMQLKDIYTEALRDPELLALLLEKAPTPRKQIELLGKFNAYLNGIGIRWLNEEEEEQMLQGFSPQEFQGQQEPMQEESAAPAPRPAAQQPMPQPMPQSQPQARVQPPMAAPTPTPQAQAPQAAPNLQQRQQYASMFPYESTSQMIRGGIGSLT